MFEFSGHVSCFMHSIHLSGRTSFSLALRCQLKSEVRSIMYDLSLDTFHVHVVS